MIKNQTPHDHFFKSTFHQPQILASTLQGLLPPEIVREIAFDTLTYLPGESIGSALEGSSLADLVFSVSLAGVPARLAIILEHKSAPDPRVHFQIIRYIVGSWNQSLNEGKSPVPVLPVLFYHGRSPWSIPTRLSDLLETPECIRPHVPDFDLLTIDLGRIEDKVIIENVSDLVAQSRLLSMKHIFDRDFRKYLSTIFQPLDGKKIPRDKMRETFELSIIYFSSVYPGLSTDDILSELNIVIKKEKVPDVNDLLRDIRFKINRQKGFEKGRQEGFLESCREDIEHLLRKKILSPRQIAEVLEVDPIWVIYIDRSLEDRISSQD